MKQFSLEKYLENPNRKVVTRGGRAVRTICTDRKFKYLNVQYPVMALIKGFDDDNVIIAAVESKTSSPVKFIRNENMESNIKGLYPIGEGSGYAGGITTSAIEGIKIAKIISSIYKI